MVTGFQALQPLLVAQGVFSGGCDAAVAPPVTAPPPPSPPSPPSPQLHVFAADVSAAAAACPSQTRALSTMFLVGGGVSNIFAFVAAMMLRAWDLRIVSVVGGALCALGCGLFATGRDAAITPAFALIAAGGSVVQMASLHVANVYERHRGLVMTLLLTGTDVSAGTFLLLEIAAEHSGASLQTLFLALMSLPLAYCVFGGLVQPAKQTFLASTGDAREFFAVRAVRSAKEQMLTLEFSVFLVWACVGSACVYSFVATVREQLLAAAPADASVAATASHVAFVTEAMRVFDWILPFVALVAVPFFGALLDKTGTLAGVAVATILLIAYQVALLRVAAGDDGAGASNGTLPYVVFVVFTIARALLFSLYGHIANLMFGANFVTLLGVLLPAAGAAVLADIALTQSVKTSGAGFQTANYAFLAATVVTSVAFLCVIKTRLIVVLSAKTVAVTAVDGEDMLTTVQHHQDDGKTKALLSAYLPDP
jgi:hypothetical protein